MSLRKVAATRVFLNFSKFYTNYVIELDNHIVISHYPLTVEIPYTEWLGGTIVIKNQHAYHTNKILGSEDIDKDNICITDMVEL